MVFDPAIDAVVLYGGTINSSEFPDTWMWGAPLPGTVPDAPVIGAATAGNAQATVSFSPPSSDGGQPILSYTVTASDTTDPANGGETATGPSSPITLTGLTNGDTYTFTVTAANILGPGPPSAASDTVVPAPTVPDAPVIGAATAGNAQATVSFSPPSSDGGQPILSYTVTASDTTDPANGGETATGPNSPITLTGLTNGDTYTFTVTAANILGPGPPSAASNAVVPEYFHISTAALPAAARGLPYGPVTLTTVDPGISTSPYVTTLKWGKISLLKGLRLSHTAVLSGIPNMHLGAGPGSVTVQVTETVTTLNSRMRPVRTKTTVRATIPLAIT